MVCCFVPGCKSGRSGRKSHMFRAPPQVLDQWKEILRKVRKDKEYSSVPKDSHKLCSLHFEERYIVKANKFLIRGEWVELPRLAWALQPDAVPTIFNFDNPSWRGTARNEEVEDAEGEYVEHEPEVKKTVKSYKAPRSGRNTVGTKGKCFMCGGRVTQDVEYMTSGPNTSEVTSLNKLANYLEIDLGGIFGPSSNIHPKSSSSSLVFTTIQNEVNAWLCNKCTGESNALTELLKELEIIQNRVSTSLRTLSGRLMQVETQQHASGTSSSCTEPGPSGEGGSGAETKLREELIRKCSSHQCNTESLPAGTSTCSHLSHPHSHKQQVEFIYQDEHGAYGRFKEEDLFIRQNVDAAAVNPKGWNHCLPLSVTPVSDAERQEEEITSEDVLNKKFKCNHCGKTFKYKKHLENHERICTTNVVDPLSTKPQGYDPDQDLENSCPYCYKTFELQCNIRLHVLNKHRLKIFRRYFPAGSAKELVLSTVRNVVREYKELKGGQFKCSYCPRKFSKKDVELLVVQNHTLLTHFTEIVTRLKEITAIDNGEGVKEVKIETQSDLNSDNVTEVTSPSSLSLPEVKVKLEPGDDEHDDVCFLEEVVPPKRSKR